MKIDERRFSSRKIIDIAVNKQVAGHECRFQASDVSPTGIRIRKHASDSANEFISNLELHLVPDAVTTVLTGRCVWENDDYQAYEFISPTFAQQMMLERLAGNI